MNGFLAGFTSSAVIVSSATVLVIAGYCYIVYRDSKPNSPMEYAFSLCVLPFVGAWCVIGLVEEFKKK